MTNPSCTYRGQLIAAEISRLTRYSDLLIQSSPLAHDDLTLLGEIDCRDKTTKLDLKKLSLSRTPVFFFNTNFNHDLDIQNTLQKIRDICPRGGRVVAAVYNPYWSWLYRWMTKLKIRKGELPSTFLRRVDLYQLAKLSHFEVVRIRPAVFVPFNIPLLSGFLNRWVPAIPVLRWICFTAIATLRPVPKQNEILPRPSLSVVIPARNEKGNIEAALKRMPDLGTDLEVIFVEGNSTDKTWEEILRVQREYKDRFKIVVLQQPGKGKNDAVRTGFAQATKDLLTILDADLTMPPELLGRFYEAYVSGQADFINGSRLLYPMEGEAMRFLNHLGNIFFAKALSFVLDRDFSDTLCGTKLMSRADYNRFVAWRKDFGDFDPFGDFELIFPSCILGLGSVDIPIRYLARTYGSTNIHRFRHGLILLRMTLIGLFRLRAGVAR